VAQFNLRARCVRVAGSATGVLIQLCAVMAVGDVIASCSDYERELWVRLSGVTQSEDVKLLLERWIY